MKIETSTDYKAFKFFSYNRDIMPAHVQRLKNSIIKYGNLRPVSVLKVKAGKGFTYWIIDGQHGFTALKELKKEIFFIVLDINPEDVPEIMGNINSSSKTWKAEIYLDLWVDLKKEDYIYLKRTIEKHKISIRSFFMLYGKTDTTMEEFKKGVLSISILRRERIAKKIKQLTDILIIFKEDKDMINQTAFKNAILCLLNNLRYDHKKMIQKLTKYAGKIRRCGNQTDYVFLFQEVYNRGVSKKITFSKKQ